MIDIGEVRIARPYLLETGRAPPCTDVGIAIDTGRDAAMGAPDGDARLRSVVTALRISRATMRTLKQNLFSPSSTTCWRISLAAGVFYRFFGWTLSPIIAGAIMALSSVSVLSNTLWLRALSANVAKRSPTAGDYEHSQHDRDLVPVKTAADDAGAGSQLTLLS